jgi:hypothetical protein
MKLGKKMRKRSREFWDNRHNDDYNGGVSNLDEGYTSLMMISLVALLHNKGCEQCVIWVESWRLSILLYMSLMHALSWKARLDPLIIWRVDDIRWFQCSTTFHFNQRKKYKITSIVAPFILGPSLKLNIWAKLRLSLFCHNSGSKSPKTKN